MAPCQASGHDIIYLNAKNGAAGLGHAALLFKYKGEWRYYSWEGKGYKSEHAKLKVVKKGIKGKKVTKDVNKAKNINRPLNKYYTHYIYIGISSSKSYNYAKELSEGRHYRTYVAYAHNCAWVAIDILRNGKVNDKQYKQLYNLQFKEIERGNETVIGIECIIPNEVLKKVAKIFGTKVKNIN